MVKNAKKKRSRLDRPRYNAPMIKTMTKRSVCRPLRKLVHLMKAVATGAGDDDVELIHNLRTESRRADVVLRLFADCLPHDRTAWLRRKLDQIRSKAGIVRDLEVIVPLLERVGDPLPARTRKMLSDWINGCRAKEFDSFKRYCRRLLDRGFVDRIRRVSLRNGWRKLAAGRNIPKLGSRFVSRLATKFFRQVDLLKSDEQQLHKVRILGRRLRYTLQLLQDLGTDADAASNADIETACRRLSEMQEALGHVHDSMSAPRVLYEFVAESSQHLVDEALRRVIDSLEASIYRDGQAVIQEVIDKANQVQNALMELTSQG